MASRQRWAGECERVRGARSLLLVPGLCLGLSACLPGGDGQGTTAPGLNTRGQAVDGLTVGHRLQEAGEHELALKSYYRAAAQHGATADVLSAIGSANLSLGRLGQAEQMLRRAIEQDGEFVPALNNLGVVLLEKGETGEAARVFRQAYALDSGKTDAIRENLRLALARSSNPGYSEPEEIKDFALVRRGQGEYLLVTK